MASGSGSSQATSVLSPRGATVWPASCEPAGQLGGLRAAAGEDVVEAVALEHLERAGDSAATSRESDGVSKRRASALYGDSSPRVVSSKEM